MRNLLKYLLATTVTVHLVGCGGTSNPVKPSTMKTAKPTSLALDKHYRQQKAILADRKIAKTLRAMPKPTKFKVAPPRPKRTKSFKIGESGLLRGRIKPCKFAKARPWRMDHLATTHLGTYSGPIRLIQNGNLCVYAVQFTAKKSGTVSGFAPFDEKIDLVVTDPSKLAKAPAVERVPIPKQTIVPRGTLPNMVAFIGFKRNVTVEKGKCDQKHDTWGAELRKLPKLKTGYFLENSEDLRKKQPKRKCYAHAGQRRIYFIPTKVGTETVTLYGEKMKIIVNQQP